MAAGGGGATHRIRVWMMDNGYKLIDVSAAATVQDVVGLVVKRLGVRDEALVTACCGICECLDGVTISRELAPTEAIMPTKTSWDTKGLKMARFVFRVSLFTGRLLDTAYTDKALMHLLYLDCVYNVISGLYPVSVTEASRLASLQLQTTYGDHNPVRHRAGLLVPQLHGLIPRRFRGEKSNEEWESSLLLAHKLLTPRQQAHPEKAYVHSLSSKPYFGLALFYVSQTFAPPEKLPARFILGVGKNGITLHKEADKSVFETFGMSEMYRWGFKRNETFYWELKPAHTRDFPATIPASGGKGPLYQVATKEGKTASDLLTAHALQMLEEMKLKKAGKSSSVREEEAASRIAALTKGHLTRTKLQRKVAATTIQALTRGYLARQRFEKMLDALEEELGDD